jgi:RNA polymerase sigma-70 factor (ECF subfamily)
MGWDKIHITKRLVAGDMKALKAIHDFHYDKFFYIAQGFIKSQPDVEELLQDLFLKLWLSRVKLDIQLSYEGYLYRSFKNAIYNKLKSLARTNLTREDLQDVFISSGNTDDNLICRELEELYGKALQELPPQRQRIFRLRRIEGLSNKQVAELCGISVKMVEKQMTLALSSLRSKLIASKEHLLLVILSYLL